MCNSCTPYYWTGYGWNRNAQSENYVSTMASGSTVNGGNSHGCCSILGQLQNLICGNSANNGASNGSNGCHCGCRCCCRQCGYSSQCYNTITIPVTGQLTVRVPSTTANGTGVSFNGGGRCGGWYNA